VICVGREYLTVYWRDMLRFFRFRGLLASTLLQPALWMAFFGVAMSSNFNRLSAVISVPPGVVSIEYLTFMGAGVIAMTTLFTSLYGGINLLFDKTYGVMREILGSPMPRSHLVLGIGLSGVTKSFIQTSVIMVFGLLIGVKFFEGAAPAGILVSILGVFAFVGVFALGFIFLSSTIAMRMESHEGLQAITTLLSMPLFFTSNALYPVEAFPPILRAFSAVNPLTYLINGIRYFAIGNDFYAFGTHYVYSVADVLASFGVLVVFALVMFATALYTVDRVNVV